MKKVSALALLLLAGNEIVSLAVLTVLCVAFLCWIVKEAEA